MFDQIYQPGNMTVTDISLRSAPQVRVSKWSLRKPSVLPGFGLTLGFTLCYLSLIVLIPLAGLFLARSGWAGPASGRR